LYGDEIYYGLTLNEGNVPFEKIKFGRAPSGVITNLSVGLIAAELASAICKVK
jgi:hypothetical protein